MGGQALKHVGVTRKTAEEYYEIVTEVRSKLSALFPQTRHSDIPAYATKPSFGDADILLESTSLPSNWVELAKAAFKPQDWVSNGTVHSLDVSGLQVDLITVPKESFDFAKAYFSYNDLGNLMGRIAHKMGFKYGHLGLFCPLRDGTHQFAEIPLTQDPAKAMVFLGFDPVRHAQGFDTLDAVFNYAISSPYTSRDIFLLMNRNAKSRVRDSKRPTYTAFLTWLETHPEADKYTWKFHLDEPTYHALRAEEKQTFLTQAFTAFPGFKAEYDQAIASRRASIERNAFFNGTTVQELTKLSGKALGEFIQHCKSDPDFGALLDRQDTSELHQFVAKKQQNFSPRENQEAKTFSKGPRRSP